MSGPKCMDVRTMVLQDAAALAQLAQSMLGAMSTGVQSTDLGLSQIDTHGAAKAFADMYARDVLDTDYRADLQARLAQASSVDYSPSALGEFKPVVKMPRVTVDVRGSEDNQNVKQIAHLVVPEMGNAQMAIFEVTNSDGTTSAMVGLDDLLFDAEGNWKNDQHKTAYEGFLQQALRLQADKAATEQKRASTALKSDLKRRGFEVTRQANKGPATHNVVTKPTQEAVAEKKFRSAGNE